MKLHTDVPRYTSTQMFVFCMHVQYYFRRLLLATSVRIFGKIRTNEIVYKVGSWLTKTIIDKVEGYVRFDKRCFASLTSDPASDLFLPLIEMPIRCKRERIKQTIAIIFWIAVQTTNYYYYWKSECFCGECGKEFAGHVWNRILWFVWVKGVPRTYKDVIVV